MTVLGYVVMPCVEICWEKTVFHRKVKFAGNLEFLLVGHIDWLYAADRYMSFTSASHPAVLNAVLVVWIGRISDFEAKLVIITSFKQILSFINTVTVWRHQIARFYAI